jgi:hypothetical protein
MSSILVLPELTRTNYGKGGVRLIPDSCHLGYPFLRQGT